MLKKYSYKGVYLLITLAVAFSIVFAGLLALANSIDRTKVTDKGAVTATGEEGMPLLPNSDPVFVSDTSYSCNQGLLDDFSNASLSKWSATGAWSVAVGNVAAQVNAAASQQNAALTLNTPVSGSFAIEVDIANLQIPLNANNARATLEIHPVVNGVHHYTEEQLVSVRWGQTANRKAISAVHEIPGLVSVGNFAEFANTRTRVKIERKGQVIRTYYRRLGETNFTLLSSSKLSANFDQFQIRLWLQNFENFPQARVEFDNVKLSCPGSEPASSGISYASQALNNAKFTCSSALADSFNQLSPLLWATKSSYGTATVEGGSLKLATSNLTSQVSYAEIALNKMVSGNFAAEYDVKSFAAIGKATNNGIIAGLFARAIVAGAISNDDSMTLGLNQSGAMTSIEILSRSIINSATTMANAPWTNSKPIRIRVERTGTNFKTYYKYLDGSSTYTLMQNVTVPDLSGDIFLSLFSEVYGTAPYPKLTSLFDNFKLSCLDTGTTIPLHQFYSGVYKKYFYTASETEKNKIINTDPNWSYLLVSFNVKDRNSCSLNGQSVFRFYSPVFKAHFFTAKLSERDKLINTDPNWNYEGEGFCISMASGAGLKPVYRLYNSNLRTHHFTTKLADVNKLVATGLWKSENIVFYAW